MLQPLGDFKLKIYAKKEFDYQRHTESLQENVIEIAI